MTPSWEESGCPPLCQKSRVHIWCSDRRRDSLVCCDQPTRRRGGGSRVDRIVRRSSHWSCRSRSGGFAASLAVGLGLSTLGLWAAIGLRRSLSSARVRKRAASQTTAPDYLLGGIGRIVVAAIAAITGRMMNHVAAPLYPPLALLATAKATGPKAVEATFTNEAVP